MPFLQRSNKHFLSDSESQASSSLSAYFSKKKAPPKKKQPLFRFQATTHAINVSAFIEDSKLDAEFELTMESPRETRAWLCPPAPQNISTLFRPTIQFAAEIENRKLNGKSVGAGEKSELRKFVEKYVMDSYLPKVQSELREAGDEALGGVEAWSSVVSGEEARMMKVEAPVPVLISCAKTYQLCLRVESEIRAVPAFADRLAALWLLILTEYHSRVNTVYEEATRSIRQPEGRPEPEAWRKISAAWAVDEDISRLLKSLPNWLSLVEGSVAPTPDPTPSITSPPSHPATNSLPEAGHQVRERNQRESQILIGNLGNQKQIEQWEIIEDDSHICSLAHIHESLEWFCSSVRKAISALPQVILDKLAKAAVEVRREVGGSEVVEVETLREGLERRLGALEAMAATCLLMLHLELRVHVFFHLLPLARRPSHTLGSRESQEPDPGVLSLNRDLLKLHKLLSSLLQERKLRFMFEGLGHLGAELLVSAAQHMKGINDNGKKRMCRNIFALQQCLSGITHSREPDLDRARNFYQLLYLPPDDILANILEKGTQFGELDYRHLMSLAVRSSSGLSSEPGALDARLTRLRQILADRPPPPS